MLGRQAREVESLAAMPREPDVGVGSPATTSFSVSADGTDGASGYLPAFATAEEEEGCTSNIGTEGFWQPRLR